jgi:hypothetical protein
MAVLKGCSRQYVFQFKWKRRVVIRPYPRAGVLKLFFTLDPFECVTVNSGSNPERAHRDKFPWL